MSRAERERQAQAFLDYPHRAGDHLEVAFDRWAESKDFLRADAVAIYWLVRQELIARSERSASAEDWFNTAGAA
jgi:hypothetical protein